MNSKEKYADIIIRTVKKTIVRNTEVKCSDISRVILVLVAIGIALSPLTPVMVHRGSLVIAMVSRKGDYVVVAGESRSLDQSQIPVDDRSCKVIALGRDTLFFETGASFIGVRRGKPWDGRSVARAIYRESKKLDAKGLSVAWGNKALQWFYGQAEQDLRTLTGTEGTIVTGGFVNFQDDGTPSVQRQTIFYSDNTHTIGRRADDKPQGPGQITISGVALNLVQEFFDGKTRRAVDAFGPIGVVRLICVDPMIDSSLARKAIQFSMDNSTSKEKGWLGGPIDIAVVRKGQRIEWVSRKKQCYGQDQKPTR
jgi:hypothetical protein